jgi:hypothetical protein
MKRPAVLWFHPADITKDDEDGALWYRMPPWIVRAYRLRKHTMTHRVMFRIADKGICFDKARKKYHTMIVRKYWDANWHKKLNKERAGER